jgi:hypothetical protein
MERCLKACQAFGLKADCDRRLIAAAGHGVHADAHIADLAGSV